MSDPVVTVDPMLLDSTGKVIVTKLEAIKTAIQNGGGGGGTTVVANPQAAATDDLEKLQVGQVVYAIPVTEVEVTPIQQTGTKIATIEVDGQNHDLYAPNGGGGGGDSVSWNQIQQSGTKIAEVTINNVTTNVFAPNGGGGGSVATEMIYTGRESQYYTDAADSPVEFDVRSQGTNFSSYLSTSDNKTFTVLQDFSAIVSYGIEQDPNQTSSNRPNVTFYRNGVGEFSIETPSASSGSNVVTAVSTVLFQNDTIFWGSNNTSGYAIRLGQIDRVQIDFTNFSKPTFPSI